MFVPLLVLLLHALAHVQGQSTTASVTEPPSASTEPPTSLSLTTGSVTLTIPTTRSNQATQVVTVVPAVFNVTYTLTPSATSSDTAPSQTASDTPTPTPDPFVLETKVDPAFGVLGVILILTGLPSAFWGHKNRWTSFFLIGFYTLSLVCFVLILKFGILPAINPPSRTLRGMFVLSCTIAGFIGGAIAIFFWKGTRYGLGFWGGFALALFIQSLHNGGLIKNIGYRWIFFIGCGVAGFTLSTIPKIHYHVLLISTAFVGATSFMLGVDCFTTAGLKEFYIWNLGFPGLFPKFVNNGIQFPVSQTMQIELGLMGAVALMGIAVQLRILKVLQRKMQEIAEESKKRDEEAELQASDRVKGLSEERDAWEKDHPSLTKHGRNDSSLSSMPLMKDREGTPSPDAARTRQISVLSEFKPAPPSEEDLKRATRMNQTPGALPALDLGLAIQEDVPSSFIAKNVEVTAADVEEYKRKETILAEIQNLRRSIEVLKSETPVPSSSEQSRRPSLTSRRTTSLDVQGVLLPPAHARPPRETDPRARVHSMELSTLTRDAKEPISRPTSAPLKDDWDTYIQERKLLQPPAGVSPPIATTSAATHRAPVSPAVQEALERRKRRESAMHLTASSDSSEDIPLARVVQQKPNPAPVTILPPRRSSGHIVAPVPQVAAATRTRTFEELNERHREKIRDLQAPLTQAEKEHAELEAARQRWERSKALEREIVTQRLAEKAAALEKRQKATSPEGERRQSSGHDPRSSRHRHSRSLSADKLRDHGMSSKKKSMLKVEDWQRYQQDAEMSGGGSSSRRDLRQPTAQGVPFPNEMGRRKSKDFGMDQYGTVIRSGDGLVTAWEGVTRAQTKLSRLGEFANSHPRPALTPVPTDHTNAPAKSPHTPSSSSASTPNIPTAGPTASLQSILTASKPDARNGQAPAQPWPPHVADHPAPVGAIAQQPSSSKRKLEDPESDDPHTKIRRIVRDHVLQDPSRVMPMTTVICLHAAVAQKSYGSEKRFLCPPPVVHIEGPVWHMRTQQLAMAVVSESGDRSFEQKAPLDNNMTASFKFLHVTGTAKAKSFQLSLDIAEPPPPALTPEGGEPPSGRVWASFDSAPVTIISKPSKKTAKTRNISSCILAGGPVSLFNRINSQTVRTKYMTIDHAQLCASNVAWSAFNVNVVRRPGPGASSTVVTGPQPVTYGCEIVLSDTHSGISTSPLVIRKVDKGKVTHDEGGPVSQMQKIALQRVNPDGSRHYLSAAGPMPGTPGVVAPPAPGMSSQAGTHPLLFQSPRVREEIKDGFRIVCDEVDDYLCWTIVGISKFQYTFFDAFGQNNNIPELPITPFPTLFTAPVYRPANNTVELTVSNFFYDHPTTRQQTPLDVYLGNLGPLRLRVYQAAPPGPLTNISPFMASAPGGQVMDGREAAPGSPNPQRYIPSPLHTIVIVEMPPLADVVKALEDDALPTPINAPDTGKGQASEASTSEGTSEPPGPPPAPSMASIAGRSLPLLFIRASDGVGYHSGRTIACENVFQGMDLGGIATNQANGSAGNIDTGWIAAAQAAAVADGGMHGWTLRVM